MTDKKHHEKQVETTTNNGVVIAAVAGAVVGAGMALAGSIALKDEKNRERVKEILTNTKNQATAYIRDFQSQVKNETATSKDKPIIGKKTLTK